MRVVLLTCLAAVGFCAAARAGAEGPATGGAAPAAPSAASRTQAGRPPAPLVDLNRASLAALMTLPGIDEALAKRIVKGRPYKTKTDLVEKKVLELPAYDEIRRLVVVDHRRNVPRPGSTPAASPAVAPPAASKPAS